MAMAPAVLKSFFLVIGTWTVSTFLCKASLSDSGILELIWDEDKIEELEIDCSFLTEMEVTNSICRLLNSLYGSVKMPTAALATPPAVARDAEEIAVMGSQRRFCLYIGFGSYLVAG
jgi:hypothetical protein